MVLISGVSRAGRTTNMRLGTAIMAEALSNTKSTIDTIVATVSIGGQPEGLAYDGNTHVWVSNLTGQTVSRINIATNVIDSAPTLGGDPNYTMYTHWRMWMARFIFNDSAVYDSTTVTSVTTANLPYAGSNTQLAYDGLHAWGIYNTGSGFTPAKFDATTGTLVSFVPTVNGSATSGPICFDGTYIWCAYAFPILKKIDPVAMTVVATVNVSAAFNNFGDLYFGGGYVWVSDNFGSLFKIDPNSLAITQIAISGQGMGMVYANGYLWLVDDYTYTLLKINVSSNTIVKTITGFNVPFAVDYDGTNLWVANNGNGTVSKVYIGTDSASGNIVSTVSLTAGSNPTAVCFDGANIWSSNQTTNKVTKILASTGAIVNSYSVGTSPQDICFDGTNIWTANSGSNNVTKILASTGAVVSTPSTQSIPQSICYDGTFIWTANRGSDSVTKITASTGAVVGSYPVNQVPEYLTVVGNKIWVSCLINGYVDSVDQSTGTSTTLVALNAGGALAGPMYYDGLYVWLCNGSTIIQMNSSTGAVIATFPSGAVAAAGTVPVGPYLWVPDDNNGAGVSKLLASTMTVLNTYPTGAGFVNNRKSVFDGTYLWIPQFSNDTVTKMAV